MHPSNVRNVAICRHLRKGNGLETSNRDELDLAKEQSRHSQRTSYVSSFRCFSLHQHVDHPLQNPHLPPHPCSRVQTSVETVLRHSRNWVASPYMPDTDKCCLMSLSEFR